MYVNSFGWGGEPSNALRLRLDKNKWYDFRTSFRRDQNYFDYDLLANPLNPATSTPTITVNSSPHLFATTRRLTDIDLTLLPQSWITFRLGYSHNNMFAQFCHLVHAAFRRLFLFSLASAFCLVLLSLLPCVFFLAFRKG